MPKTKIVNNVDTNGFNFDYRVCKHWTRNKKKQRLLIDGEPQYSLYIHEIHFGEDGEIIAYIKDPERPYGDDFESLKFEMNELMEALDKPILDFDFVVEQTKLSSRRSRRRMKKNMEPTNTMEICLERMNEVEKGTAKLTTLEDMYAEHGWKMPVITYEGDDQE